MQKSISRIRYSTVPVVNQFPWSSWETKKKPRLLILGTGWASTTILKNLKKNQYETIVGTVEYRSLLENTRKICRHSGAHYFAASADDVDFDKKTVLAIDTDNNQVEIPYDKLVIALGARNETYGIPGVKENVHFCKTIKDARNIRDKLTTIFEKASNPIISEEERQRLLTFVVVGGGPTGVRHVKVILIQGSAHILNTFDEKISEYAEERFKRQNIKVITQAFVQSVDQKSITYKVKKPDGSMETNVTDYGLCVWSTGIAMHETTQKLSSKLTDQTHRRALNVDSGLRLIGAKDAYALGDCATIVLPNIGDLILSQCHEDMHVEELNSIINQVTEKHPQSHSFLSGLKEYIEGFGDSPIKLQELKTWFEKTAAKTTTLPATAQVASQQGYYLAKKLNKLGKYDSKDWENVEERFKNFRYNHLGNFSYVGGG
ncbi:hypothetical protein HK103_003158 [Boothiomyces macroporosus]|uniref:FAD/NAD(P)-binding domain-containing protein n=1 Tax=Boothiomyces macroporosus TaxID=261099 RepID=A0AAD5UC89_9FUNG|nr:hypothetical protein HK103_003158 [Boothiomyces macroporosus]